MRQHAEEAVVRRFSRAMRASCSPLGPLTDPMIVGAATAVLVMLAGALYGGAGATMRNLLVGAAGVPIALALVVSIAQLNSRARVIDWLASLPFPVENVNGLLNGVATHLRVRFADAESLPQREELNELLDPIDPNCFALEFEDADVALRIGVLDSKYNPARSSYLRYLRVRAITAVLLPMHERHPIRDVWVS
jgi:hypothetical protein